MGFSTVDGEALDGTLNSSFTAKGKRAEYKYRYRMGGGVRHALMVGCYLEI